MSEISLIAIDWGTTNRRIYALSSDGAVIDTVRDGKGVLTMGGGDYAAEIEAVRAKFGDRPVLIAGMAGSNRGWVEAPYCPCPAGAGELAAAIHWIEPGRTGIVPGVSVLAGRHADVMRGEEVQLLGAVVAELAAPDALLCQPGTHCKWVAMDAGRVSDFVTAMTGELFALLRDHSILMGQLDGPVHDGPAFREGVADAGSGDFLSRLFGIRAAAILGGRRRRLCQRSRDRDRCRRPRSGKIRGGARGTDAWFAVRSRHHQPRRPGSRAR